MSKKEKVNAQDLVNLLWEVSQGVRDGSIPRAQGIAVARTARVLINTQRERRKILEFAGEPACSDLVKFAK